MQIGSVVGLKIYTYKHQICRGKSSTHTTTRNGSDSTGHPYKTHLREYLNFMDLKM